MWTWSYIGKKKHYLTQHTLLARLAHLEWHGSYNDHPLLNTTYYNRIYKENMMIHLWSPSMATTVGIQGSLWAATLHNDGSGTTAAGLDEKDFDDGLRLHLPYGDYQPRIYQISWMMWTTLFTITFTSLMMDVGNDPIANRLWTQWHTLDNTVDISVFLLNEYSSASSPIMLDNVAFGMVMIFRCTVVDYMKGGNTRLRRLQHCWIERDRMDNEDQDDWNQ